MTGKLTVGSDGRVTGPASIQYNAPWPCRNGYSSGFASPARGVVIHTEQGFEQGTISWFNNPASEASAWFAVGLDGTIWQFAPIGSGWCSWAQADGNQAWYSIEDADNGDPATPFAPAQLQSIAQLTEVLSRHDGFPLAVASDPFTQRGVTLHSEGGQAFGGHLQCPGTVRGAQRPQIVALAMAIRSGTPVGDWTQEMIMALPTLQQGSKDPVGGMLMVRRVQVLVAGIGAWNKLGAVTQVPADGVFSPATTAAVKTVQKFFGITGDGIVGPATWTHLVAG